MACAEDNKEVNEADNKEVNEADNKADIKLERLRRLIRECGSAAVAFSGGVDSAFLLKVAFEELRENAIAITAVSELSPRAEIDEAKAIAGDIGVKHILIGMSPLSNGDFTANTADRCYVCKTDIFRKIIEEADRLCMSRVFDGTNADDDADYRPGLRALAELGIRSPLKEAGIGKPEIRELSKRYGLSTWDKPSLACLASRIPYGSQITARKLSMVAEAEEFLKNMGFGQLRVRHHGDIARIELEPDSIPLVFAGDRNVRICDEFKRIGFKYVTVDIRGYRMGSLNE